MSVIIGLLGYVYKRQGLASCTSFDQNHSELRKVVQKVFESGKSHKRGGGKVKDFVKSDFVKSFQL